MLRGVRCVLGLHLWAKMFFEVSVSAWCRTYFFLFCSIFYYNLRQITLKRTAREKKTLSFKTCVLFHIVNNVFKIFLNQGGTFQTNANEQSSSCYEKI